MCENTIVRTMPGQETPKEFWTRGPKCDHCKHNRRRNNTYVVRHEDGRHMQVGSTCIEDFLGIHAVKCLPMVDIRLAAEGLLGEEGGAFGGKVNAYSLEEFLSWVVKDIRENGWVSRAQAYESGRLASADRAWTEMTDSFKRHA